MFVLGTSGIDRTCLPTDDSPAVLTRIYDACLSKAGIRNMNTRSFVASLLSALAVVGCMSPPLAAEENSTSTIDPEQLSRVAKAWAYPQDNRLSIKPGIGRVFPMHVVVSQTTDSLDHVCRYYAKKCGYRSFDDLDVRATGESEHGIFLVRDHRADAGAEVPRVIFMHYNQDHTVSVTVMRPEKSSQTQVDLAVSVR